MMSKICNTIKSYGFVGVIVKAFKIVFWKCFHRFAVIEEKIYIKRKEKPILKDIKMKKKYLKKKMLNRKYKNIYVFYPYAEWNLPIFQRPHQIALELSKNENNLYFFCTINRVYDKVDIYEEINDNLIVTTEYDFLMNIKTKKRILHLYSTDTLSTYDEVLNAYNNGNRILYEYIDEIHEEITHSLPKEYLKKHKMILKNEDFYIVTTADKLYKDALKFRKNKVTLATNGVNINDFINKKFVIPNDLKPLKKKYKKIILYYGALAVWFDYKLLKEAAKKYPNYAFVLIGMIYDDSFKKSRVEKIDNIIYLGKVNYYKLVNYSKNSDLLTIPFLINEITESTSPVKLFEYMASQVPILTTDMNECRKYETVMIGKNHEEYIDMIPKAIEKANDKEYLLKEMEEAKENTWTKKVEEIEKLIDNN